MTGCPTIPGRLRPRPRAPLTLRDVLATLAALLVPSLLVLALAARGVR